MEQIDKKGLVYCLAAYLFWGFMPFYFKAVAAVSDLEVLSHRVLWSAVMVGAVLLYQKRLGQTWQSLKSWKNFCGMVICSALIGANWLIFIFAVASGHILESSFGYFISPILIIALGVVFLGERLSRGQLISLILAAAGVAYQLISFNQVPWIALGLAFSFGTYGLVRKKLSMGPLQGVFIEAALLTPLAIGFLGYTEVSTETVFLNEGLGMALLLVFAGFMTFFPLWLFAEGIARIPYSLSGFFQYIVPTLHFIVAVVVFNETLSFHKLVSFGLVWVALALLIVDVRRRRTIPKTDKNHFSWKRHKASLRRGKSA